MFSIRCAVTSSAQHAFKLLNCHTKNKITFTFFAESGETFRFQSFKNLKNIKCVYKSTNDLQFNST